MKIYIGTDHVGYEFKEELKQYLKDILIGHEVVDLGAHEYKADDDYPDYVMPVAEAVARDPENSRGVILGGTGQGEAMCANKVAGVRAVVFYGEKAAIDAVDIKGEEASDTFEIVKLAREHNDANVLSIGMRFASTDEAKFAIELFLATKFSGDERHIRRINKF